MPVAGLSPTSFNVSGTLIQFGPGAHRRVAPLGILLNRIKRMPEGNVARIKIEYGGNVLRFDEIKELLDSSEYARWLEAPTVPFRWQYGGSKARSR